MPNLVDKILCQSTLTQRSSMPSTYSYKMLSLRARQVRKATARELSITLPSHSRQTHG